MVKELTKLKTEAGPKINTRPKKWHRALKVKEEALAFVP
jgi:hypothetical protein